MKEEMKYEFLMKTFTHQDLAKMYLLALTRERELRMSICHLIGQGGNGDVRKKCLDALAENGKEQL